MRVTVSTPGLLALRRDLKAIDKAGLGKDLAKGFTAVAFPLNRAIQTEASTTLPKRGGYNVVMSKSVRIRSRQRKDHLTAMVSLRIYSVGKAERRAIRQIDAGKLRHPVWGRSRRLRRGVRAGTRIPNPWAVTAVKPGFASRPIDRLGPQVQQGAEAVVNNLMRRLKG